LRRSRTIASPSGRGSDLPHPLSDAIVLDLRKAHGDRAHGPMEAADLGEGGACSQRPHEVPDLLPARPNALDDDRLVRW